MGQDFTGETMYNARMDLLQSFILGALQGVTEFVPISSSGHLVLGEHYLGLEVAELKSFDVAVHVGTLLAILLYFRRDVWGMIKGFFCFKWSNPYSKLAIYVIIATVPAVFAGLFAGDWIDEMFRSPTAVAKWMMIVGVVFLLGEWVGRRMKRTEMTWWRALIVGLAQAVALVPGISRSGSTIVAGVFQGINRVEAARFSFLMGIPAIAGAGLLTALRLNENGGLGVETGPLLLGFATSVVFGLLTIHYLLKFLKRHGLAVFGVYLLIVGTLVHFL